MENPVLAPALDVDEKQFLFDQRHSEHFRCFAKSIVYLYSLECAKLATASKEDLQVIQGRLQGLLTAKNLLVMGKIPENK